METLAHLSQALSGTAGYYDKNFVRVARYPSRVNYLYLYLEPSLFT
ncbi:MAG: hypothetical protein M3511_11180 [Deinococcota bacterium]|nr:hypothetical protein [Deinococcota bacterium]